jgi:hypothetical protein
MTTRHGFINVKKKLKKSREKSKKKGTSNIGNSKSKLNNKEKLKD